MKAYAFAIPVFLAAALSSGCLKVQPEEPVPETVRTVFSILDPGGTSRATGIRDENERNIERWALLLYNNGKLIANGTSTSDGAITLTLAAGTYTAFAVVNYPVSGGDTFYPSKMTSSTLLSQKAAGLSCNAPDSFLMVGSKSITVQATEETAQAIPVTRMVCKAGIKKVSVGFDDPVLAARPFILKGIYLTNCLLRLRYVSDYNYYELTDDESRWTNRMGLSSDSVADELLSETGLDIRIADGTSHDVAHYFYCYPNPTSSDNDTRSEDWRRRCTRMVLETEIGGITYYYPITLPGMKRNRTYIAEEVIIRSLGSRDPELEVSGSVEVTFSTSAEEWDSPLYIEEAS